MSHRKRLKPTPASSPLATTPPARLDTHGEPTHPDLVRDPGGLAPWGSCPEDAAHETGADRIGATVGTAGPIRVFWYLFADLEIRGVLVRASSYTTSGRLARAAAIEIGVRHRTTITKLRRVDMPKTAEEIEYEFNSIL